MDDEAEDEEEATVKQMVRKKDNKHHKDKGGHHLFATIVVVKDILHTGVQVKEVDNTEVEEDVTIVGDALEAEAKGVKQETLEWLVKTNQVVTSLRRYHHNNSRETETAPAW